MRSAMQYQQLVPRCQVTMLCTTMSVQTWQGARDTEHVPRLAAAQLGMQVMALFSVLVVELEVSRISQPVKMNSSQRPPIQHRSLPLPRITNSLDMCQVN